MLFFHTVREVLKSHLVDQYIDGLFVCSFGVYRPTGQFLFSLIWRRHHYRSMLNTDMAIKQWGFLACMHTYCDTGHLYIMVISEDPWHLNLLLNLLLRVEQFND